MLAGPKMRYLRTQLATDWPKERPLKAKVLRALLFFVPLGNPDYESRMHLVREWLVEFDVSDEPWREVGLGEDGEPVLAGPDDRNYGFWCDTNMKWADFTGEGITQDQFEAQWARSQPLRHGEVPSAQERDRKEA